MNQSFDFLKKKRSKILKRNFSISLSTIIAIPINYLLIKFGPWKIFNIYKTIKLNSINCENWPISVGEIVKRGEIEEKNGLFKPNIEYKYSIGDRHFIGKKLFFSFPEYLKNQEKLKEILQNYEDNNEFFVRFNPKNPSESILEPGNHFENENFQLLIKYQIFWLIFILLINYLLFTLINNKIVFSYKKINKNQEEIEYQKYERKRSFENIFLRKFDPAIPPPPTSQPNIEKEKKI